MSPLTASPPRLLESALPPTLPRSTRFDLGGVGVQCPICKSTHVQQLRGYWQDLPVESPNKGKYAPPDEVDVRQWLGILAVFFGIYVAATGSLGYGLLIALAGLLWGLWMAAQVHRYQVSLGIYNASLICKAGYHLFVP